MFLMWGYEGEEIEDIEATVEHVKVCHPDVFLTTTAYPIKGTPYYEEVQNKLVRLGEWRASTDRNIQSAAGGAAAIIVMPTICCEAPRRTLRTRRG